MPVDSSIVILPRFTTLVGATTFSTLPMDVSAFGGAQFQVWRGAFRTKSLTPTPTFTIYLDESLDTENWVLGPSAAGAHVIGQNETKFFSYNFRLRWFRLRVVIAGDEPIATCWAEGLLRGGGNGVWAPAGGSPVGDVNLPGSGRLAAATARSPYVPWTTTNDRVTQAAMQAQQLGIGVHWDPMLNALLVNKK